ncbi:MAG: DUF6010 family protein [Ferruginibacter sp.]
MIAANIGVLSGLLVILLVSLVKQLNTSLFYGLMLCGIGFLYVGFTWRDTSAVFITSVQAIIFLLIAYYATKKSLPVMALGFFLHGCWDLAYGFFATPGFIPPHYDIFCLTIDFTIGIYLLFLQQHKLKTSR